MPVEGWGVRSQKRFFWGKEAQQTHIYPCPFFSHAYLSLFTPVDWSYLFIPVPDYSYLSLFLVIHIYPFSCFIHAIPVSDYTYYPCFCLYIFIPVAIWSSMNRLFNKIEKKWKCEKIRKCTYSPLFPDPTYLFPVHWSYIHIYPCFHLQLEEKRLLNKI